MKECSDEFRAVFVVEEWSVSLGEIPSERV